MKVDVDTLEPGICYVLSEDAHTRLERAAKALDLLAALDADTMALVALSEGATAAVADYVARDLAAVLASAVIGHARAEDAE